MGRVLVETRLYRLVFLQRLIIQVEEETHLQVYVFYKRELSFQSSQPSYDYNY